MRFLPIGRCTDSYRFSPADTMPWDTSLAFAPRCQSRSCPVHDKCPLMQNHTKRIQTIQIDRSRMAEDCCAPLYAYILIYIYIYSYILCNLIYILETHQFSASVQSSCRCLLPQKRTKPGSGNEPGNWRNGCGIIPQDVTCKYLECNDVGLAKHGKTGMAGMS